jgi:hypothetical protein
VLRVAGSAVLLLSVVMTAVGPSRPVVANPPGFATPVAGIELASTPEHVLGIVGPPGAPGRPDAVRRMRLGLLLDMAFLLAYPAFHVGMALLLRAHANLAARRASLVFALAATMSVTDALENRELWVLTGLTDPAAMGPPLARLRIFTLTKWWSIFIASAVLAVGVWREQGWGRWSAPFLGLGALLGFLSFVHLPAIEWSMGPTAVAWTMLWVRALRA